MSNEILIIELDEESEGLEKRLFKGVKQYYSIDAYFQDSWCKLFNTKSYRRSREHLSKIQKMNRVMCVRLIQERLDELYPQEDNTQFSWIFSHTGSIRLVDIINGKNQRFLIKVKRIHK
ncbi:hypothetical protein Va1_127 [Vibrio phage Va1]|nr:hypothetical protein Va1_127 [Vibrio phage Va1]